MNLVGTNLKEDLSERHHETEDEPDLYHLDVTGHGEAARHAHKHGGEH